MKTRKCGSTKRKIEGITLEFVLKSGKDGKTFGSVSTKHIVEQLREKYDIRVDKRKFINAHPIGALGYSNLKLNYTKELSLLLEFTYLKNRREIYAKSFPT